jgi:hypothetical protein
MWIEISKQNPPKNKILKTKVDDLNGVRNEQELKFDGKLWWFPDGSMYVYYSPTHYWDYVLSSINGH